MMYITNIIFFVILVFGAKSFIEYLDKRDDVTVAYCMPKCKNHPVLYKNKDGSCTCNNALIIEK